MSHPRFVFAVFNFPGTTEEDLPLIAGERIEVVSRDDEFGDGWWEGVNERGQQGLFPKIYTAETLPYGSAAASQTSLSESLARVEEEPESELSMDRQEERERYQFTREAMEQLPTKPSIETIQSWTPQQVSDHFANLGLRDVSDKFIEHEVSGRILLEMQHTDLREIDINAFGKRFEIMKEIDVLRHTEALSNNLLQDMNEDATPSTPPLDFSQRSAARKSRILPQESSGVDVAADPSESSEDQAGEHIRPLIPRSNVAKSSSAATELAPAIGREAISHDRTDSGVGSSLNSTNAGESVGPVLPAAPLTTGSNMHKKSLSTSSIIATGSGKGDPITGRRSPEKRHQRTWSQDTVKINTHKRAPSGGLDAVGEEVAASIASSDSIPRSPASPASGTLTSPSSSAKPSLISKKSLLGRRPKWRPNAVSENLENTPASEAAKDADFSGWLRKRGEKSYNWKLRFFVLKGTRLAYYASDRDAQEKGLIDINSHRVGVVDDILFYGPNRNSFKIVPPAPGASRSLNFTPPKMHYFCAETKEQTRQWIAALTKATIGRDWSTPVISSCTTKTISLKAAREQRAGDTATPGPSSSTSVGGRTLEPAAELDNLPDPPVLSPGETTGRHAAALPHSPNVSRGHDRDDGDDQDEENNNDDHHDEYIRGVEQPDVQVHRLGQNVEGGAQR